MQKIELIESNLIKAININPSTKAIELVPNKLAFLNLAVLVMILKNFILFEVLVCGIEWYYNTDSSYLFTGSFLNLTLSDDNCIIVVLYAYLNIARDYLLIEISLNYHDTVIQKSSNV